ncbi:probable indole-3-acetic acid-amido synthetase GH3.8 isoform X1 [Lingula anatina]|uniref:Probable indole-3-acetic acid-amido synthetase GH3.8 isoform X1 n=2 Tax=Lingula anatina TaxID=7574 RepID=A0A2R2MJ72_LINAN|nr:probable indole-3-acetic acid-amido synthetase GH3.8 isoform X1 [Lingula anatina]|eukprot:XP_023930260.1 probable indole-3-acetic acid-amido synthetase GH3.8 isoform X1 [Lingula anatina]
MAVRGKHASWRTIFLGSGVIFAVCAALLCHKTLELYSTSLTLCVCTALCATTAALCSIVCLDISRRNPSSSHTLTSLLVQYLFVVLMIIVGKLSFPKLQKMSKDIQNTQRNVFFSVMRRNAETLYGRKYNFKAFSSPNEYIKSHPLTNYAHFEPYIDMIDNGQENVLSSQKVVFFAMTSGTTGRNKRLPILEDYKGRFFFDAACYYFYKGVDYWNMLALKRVIYVRGSSPPADRKQGLPRGSISNYLGASYPFTTTPLSAQLGHIKERETMYIHAVFGAREREVNVVDTFMASMGYTFFKVLEEDWKQICDDIEKGQIDPSLSIDDSIRSDLNQRLSPDPQRAMELRAEFSKGFEGIVSRIWPLVERIGCIRSGSHMNYAKLLEEKYAKGLPIRNSLYLASEGMIGFSMSADDSYVMLPQWNFYEFIPAENCKEEQPDTLLMHQVVKGRDYELVLTNMRGMYRYRLGDIVRVVDFFYQCPVIDIQYRLGQMLNIKNEKTPESVFYDAIIRAEATWEGIKLIDYTATESVVLERMLGKI